MTAPEVKLSPRLQEIMAHRHDHYDREEIGGRDPLYREAFAACPNDIKALQFAKGFAHFLAHKKILLCEYNILAGYPYRYTYETTMAINMPADFDPQFRPPSYVAPQQEAQDCIDFHHYAPGSPEYKQMKTFSKAIETWLFKHWESGHIIPGWERLLNLGFGGLIQEGRSYLATANEQQKQFIEAMLICDEAAAQYILRYAELARDRAEKTASTVYRQYLTRIAQACTHIAYGTPRTFFEAVQLLWLAHELLYAENYPASISFGRLDKYLYPFYQKDVAASILTYEQAADIVDALFIKFGASLHAYQNITIGGSVAGEGFLANDVTYLFLQASRKTLFDQPLLTLRYNHNMPEKMWDETIALLKTGIGLPAFFGDEVCTEAKLKMGHELADAREFGMIGCVEMACPGKEYAKTEVLRVNWGKILELMMHSGQCTCSDDKFELFHPHKLEEINTFQEFYDWYKAELLDTTAMAMDCINKLDEAVMWCYPTPYLSTLMEGCFAKGLDVTGGGTKYNNTGISACGQANAVDSLAAVKKLVFDDHKLTLTEFAAALRADFAGQEELLKAIGECPKYGNDCDEVDAYMADLVDAYGYLVDNTRNPRGGKFQLGLYSVEDHSKMGIHTGALPDGKRKGAALANAQSPVQGRDVIGPTAVINSLLKTDLTHATNGMVLDLKFSPSFFDNKRHEDALKALIKTYFDRGGMEIQFNVVSRDTLIDAQLHPEKHKDLVVRVSGFSAYFTSLIKETQDDIIARTEYQAV